MKKTSIPLLLITAILVVLACSQPEPAQLAPGSPASARTADRNTGQPTALLYQKHEIIAIFFASQYALAKSRTSDQSRLQPCH